MSHRIAIIGVLTGVLLLVAFHDVSAQQSTIDPSPGRVTGSIEDRFGQHIQGAIVVFEAKVVGKKTKHKTKTNSDGVFDLSLPAGLYDISINFVGFKRFRNKNVLVAGGQTKALDIVLEIDPKKSLTVNTRNRS